MNKPVAEMNAAERATACANIRREFADTYCTEERGIKGYFFRAWVWVGRCKQVYQIHSEADLQVIRERRATAAAEKEANGVYFLY